MSRDNDPDHSESLRFCEEYGGEPRDFPKKQPVVLPKPEPHPIPYDETPAGIREEEWKKDPFFKCCTCKYDNGTAVCEMRKKDHKVSLSHEYNPFNYCINYKPAWEKVFPNMKRRRK